MLHICPSKKTLATPFACRGKEEGLALEAVSSLRQAVHFGGVRNPSSYLLGCLKRLEGYEPHIRHSVS